MQLSQRAAALRGGGGTSSLVTRFSPWVLCSQFLLRGEKFNAVFELEVRLLVRLVLHALVLVKVLLPDTQTNMQSDNFSHRPFVSHGMDVSGYELQVQTWTNQVSLV